MNLPPSWSRMGWHEKAAYLCSSHQARDYSDACSMLAKLPRRKKKPAGVYTPETRKIRLPYADTA